MYCGEKGGQHTPKCELWGSMESNEEPLCTFCGMIGHWADNCAERQRAFQEQQQAGHLCTFCGSQEHVYLNCVLYRENLKNQKQGISNQNEEKYKMAATSQGSMAQTRQGKVHTSKKEGSKTGTQEYAIKSGPSQENISAGGRGGDKPPRKPHNTKKEPDTKVTDELEKEKEDSDKTETVSLSSAPSDYKVISTDGVEMSLRRFLKARSRRRKKCRPKGGNGGGNGSSPSLSDDDLGDDSDKFQIEVIRGKWGHRGQ